MRPLALGGGRTKPDINNWPHPILHFPPVPWSSREPSQHRVKRWGFSLEEALKDPVGRDQFLKFLESEFSSENLR